MNITDIKSPEDVFNYMNENIEYGWIDINGEKHLKTMKDFRRIYRTMSLNEILKNKIGTCIDQVWLMHYLLDKINIKNKMFCCRIFEPDDYDNIEEEEHMHCFVLYYYNSKVYHIEHPNWERKGIYEYNSEKEAINNIVNYYIKLRGGKESPTKEFYEVKPGLSFKEFNKYINNVKSSCDDYHNMKYVNDEETGKNVIIQKYPQFINSTFVGDNSGWDNYAIKVDNKYIFRFSRDEGVYRVIKTEFEILSKLKLILPKNIKVPDFIFSNLNSDYPFVGYEMIHGNFLTEEFYKNLSKEKQEIIIDNIVVFINKLHSLDVTSSSLDVINPLENYNMRYQEFKEKTYPFFDESIKKKTDFLFENYFNDENMYNYEPTVIHGDLSSDHIIITEDGIGIIDFGDTRVFDAAYDFQWAYMLGEDVLNKAIEKYKGKIDKFFTKRIKEFYVKLIPYYGVVYANEINDNNLLKKCINDINNVCLN